MPDTLRSLAGDAFKTIDVISAFHAPLTPEQLVLEQYVFLPYARSGIAAALTSPFAWNATAHASVTVKAPVIDDRGGIDAAMTVHVYGPGDVTEIDRSQVIRTLPRSDIHDAEIEDLVHVEFDRPDLPWLFTPTGPDAAGPPGAVGQPRGRGAAADHLPRSARADESCPDPPRPAPAARRCVGLGACAGDGRQARTRGDATDARAAAG